MRSLVSYDDISLPPEKEPNLLAGTHASPRPPSKRRKRSDVLHHWDDPEEETAVAKVAGEEKSREHSRELTHDEIWDDSALVDAWDAATAEYEAYHGTSQNWKNEAVNKSPLWYNVPASSSDDKHHDIQPSHPAETNTSANGKIDDDANTDENSYPVNFDTFLPSHDPSLGHFSLPHPAECPTGSLAGPQGSMVSQDEAFNRALGAMYWGGYWTAVYHCTKNRHVTLGDVKEVSSTANVEDGTIEK